MEWHSRRLCAIPMLYNLRHMTFKYFRSADESMTDDPGYIHIHFLGNVAWSGEYIIVLAKLLAHHLPPSAEKWWIWPDRQTLQTPQKACHECFSSRANTFIEHTKEIYKSLDSIYKKRIEREGEREREGKFATEGDGQGRQWLVSNLLQVCKSNPSNHRDL